MNYFLRRGASEWFSVPGGRRFTATVTGTFVGTVQIERVVTSNPGETPSVVRTLSAPGTYESDSAGVYRLRCTAYTSGQIFYSVAVDWNRGEDETTAGVEQVDVLVYGATAAGVMAALAAAREGMRVALIEPTTHVGGLVTGGLSATDVITGQARMAIVSAAREFYERCAEELGLTHQEFWRLQYSVPPRIASLVMRRMLGERDVQLTLGVSLTSVHKTGTRIRSALFSNASRISASAWVDATYEGDLLAAAGCTFSLGRESTTLYGESLAGAQFNTAGQIPDGVDPYVTSGSPSSGLLAYLFDDPVAVNGAASPYVQAPNYRLTVTRSSSRIAFPEPDAYDPADYELLGRIAAVQGVSFELPLFLELLIGGVANASGNKYDANNRGSFSTDYLHPDATAYISANSEWRAAFRERVKQYTLGLVKFVATDSRIPSAVRTDMAGIGLCPDEFQATGGFTPQLYVREGRRLVGDFVMKQADIKSHNAYGADAIAFNYYSIDSHPCWRGVVNGQAKNEGVYDSGGNTVVYGANIPLGVCLPKAAECTNLVVSCAASVSRVVYCSMRMEPIFMALGHACGVLAALHASSGQGVQVLDSTKWRRRVNTRGVYNIGTGAIIDVGGIYSQGTVAYNGTWTSTASTSGLLDSGSTVRTSTGVGATVTFRPNLKLSRMYRVFLKWSDSDSNSDAVPVTVNAANGETALTIDQTLDGSGGDWYALGEFPFLAGAPSANSVVIGTDGAGGRTHIYGVKFLPV